MKARDGALLCGTVGLLFFPLLPALWELVTLVWPSTAGGSPLLGLFFDSWDAGAQSALSRGLLRLACILVLLVALVLPAPRPWRVSPWMRPLPLFLGLGLVSSLACEHRFMALRDWELWFLGGLLVLTIVTHWRVCLEPLLLFSFYLLSGLVVLHAVWVAAPASVSRLGGVFHHPNALSTFCLMALAVLLPRALRQEGDRLLAQFGCGALLALVIGSGSLTGGAVVLGISSGLMLPAVPLRTRWGVGGFFALALIGANLLGGLWAICALPGMLLLVWLVTISTRRSSSEGLLASTAVVAAMAGLTLWVLLFLSPVESLGGANASRESSGRARLEFYRAGIAMVVAHPVLGVGPGGFSRFYPSHQRSPRAFSKFVHCLPLEIAAEWGLPALLAVSWLVWGAARRACSPAASEVQMTAGWVLLVFGLHSTTDVQTQFPYLLILVAVALGALGSPPADDGPSEREGPPGENVLDLVARVLLFTLLLALLAVECARVGAAFDRSLATRISERARSREALEVSQELLEASFLADPLDSESARLWGSMLFALDSRQQVGVGLANLARQLDPSRASCLHLGLLNRPRSDLRIAEAIAADDINYPVFYRYQAENLWEQGKPGEALEVLRPVAERYARADQLDLADFRIDDLDDQLLEMWMLKAMLESGQAMNRAALKDLRRAVRCSRFKKGRLERLVAYPETLGRPLERRLRVALEQLLEDVPTEQRPASVSQSLREPQQL